MDELRGDITEILIKTLYRQVYDCGKTATQILMWEREAISLYHGNPQFHALIDLQLFLIMGAIDKQKERDMSDIGAKRRDLILKEMRIA